jgi:hypothetical protein
VAELDGESGVNLAVKFAQVQLDYRECLATIAALKKALGK